MDCTHKRGELEDNGYYDWDGEWVEDLRYVERNTFEDIDLHRYRCTSCGYIGYYSERARKYYVEGEGEL